LKACPNGLSFGQASWQDEQGIPYFRAKAGMGCALAGTIGKAEAGRLSTRRPQKTKAMQSMPEKYLAIFSVARQPETGSQNCISTAPFLMDE
jgi:hypothetical protein